MGHTDLAPGFYWYREARDKTWQVLELYRARLGETMATRVLAPFSDDEGISLCDLPGRFIGPLTPPAED